jgi:Flp pilus assembly protein CpaB
VKRQTLVLVVIGVVLFVAGGGIAFASVIASNKNQPATSAGVVATPVVVANGEIPAGTTGAAMVAQGLVSIQSIPQRKYLATDLTSLQSLTDVVLTSSVAKGDAITATQLTPSKSAVSLPKGLNGVTVTVSGVAGLAGYLQPGSNVDVYGNITSLSKSTSTTGTTPVASNIPLPCTELLMSNIEVLDVSSVVPALKPDPSSAGRTVPASITILMAVTPAQAQVITYMSQYQTVSVTQTQKDAVPVPTGQCISTAQTTTGS